MREKVKQTFTKYLEKLNLYGYDVDVFTEKDKEWKKPKNNTFTTYVDHPYKRITLNVGKDARINTDHLLHEALHVLLWRYAYLAEGRYITEKELFNEEEQVVDHLTNTLYPYLK